MDCIFCSIVSGDAPSTMIYQDDNVSAFSNIQPVKEGHTLVIPNKHSVNIYDMSEESAASLMISAKKVAKILTDKYEATGINILNANGEDAQQSVFHTHLHLIPRHKDDGLDLWIKQRL